MKEAKTWVIAYYYFRALTFFIEALITHNSNLKKKVILSVRNGSCKRKLNVLRDRKKKKRVDRSLEGDLLHLRRKKRKEKIEMTRFHRLDDAKEVNNYYDL